MKKFIPVIAIIILIISFNDPVSAESTDNSDQNEAIENDPFENDDMELSSGKSSGEISDPLEGYNRVINSFNDKLYFYFLKPISKGYNLILPKPARKCVNRVFNNASMPGRFINCLLQGKVKGAGLEIARFSINTTFGLGGLFSPADGCIQEYEEDSGQTLGHYGIGTGIYIVWPFLGPSNLRDTAGTFMDIGLDPLTYVNIKFRERFSIKSYDIINKTSLRLGDYEKLKESSIDPYIALRNAYSQHRQSAVNN